MGIMDGIMDAGAAGRWFKFEKHGDTVEGEVRSISERQVKDFTTKEPQFWDDGEPKIEVLIALQTRLPREDEDDDGVRVVRIKGWGIQRNALREACLKVGQPPQQGDTFRATYVSDERSKRGGFPAKAFEYAFVHTTYADTDTPF